MSSRISPSGSRRCKSCGGSTTSRAAERKRLQGELDESEAVAGRLSGRLGNEQFIGKAPADVVERERQRLAGLQERQAQLRALLTELGE